MSQIDKRESAFLKDLYLHELWTSRFVDLLDKSLKTDEAPENIAYINAGTGNHVFALRERFGKESEIFPFCEDEETLRIAVGKAEAMLSDVTFRCGDCDGDDFELVILDASMSAPEELEPKIRSAVEACRPGGSVAMLCVTAGSFGEIYSLLWENYFSAGDLEGGQKVEKLINEIFTCTALEETAKSAGLHKVVTKISNETFELGEDEDISSSVLLKKFLLPRWLGTNDESVVNETLDSLVRLMKEEDADLAFRFSVKATLLTGTKK